jgi:hypothetical protein
VQNVRLLKDDNLKSVSVPKRGPQSTAYIARVEQSAHANEPLIFVESVSVNIRIARMDWNETYADVSVEGIDLFLGHSKLVIDGLDYLIYGRVKAVV